MLFLEPFTLQPYHSFQLGLRQATCRTHTDQYLVYSNNVWGWGRRFYFMVELDYEVKGKKSLLYDYS